MWLFPAAASAVSGIFSGTLARGWVSRRRPNLLVWSVALAMFAVASLAAAVGLLIGWSAPVFRIYYLFGAIVNVPVLALGSIYLLASRRVAHIAAVVVLIAGLWAAGEVFAADLDRAGLATSGIPRASEVMPGPVRTLSRYFSFTGFLVGAGAALRSSWTLRNKAGEQMRRLAQANILIAAGTIVVAVASGFARYGQGLVFSVGLLAGVTVMFAGFMKTRPPRA